MILTHKYRHNQEFYQNVSNSFLFFHFSDSLGSTFECSNYKFM